MRAAAIVVATILFALSAMHVYWAAGGRRGEEAVVPRKPGDARGLFEPPFLLTLLVALLLAGAGGVMLARVSVLPLPPALHAPVRIAAGVMAVAFLGRAVGEFRYVGLFKRVRGTVFARWDDRLFIPLCVVIGGVSVWLVLAR